MKKYSLRELREKNNMTLEQVGQKMGVNRQAIHCWETGKRTPQIRNIYKFLEIYGVKFEDVEWIVKEK